MESPGDQQTHNDEVPNASLDEFSWTYAVPITECILMTIGTCYMLWGYADKKYTSIGILLTVLVGWLVSFSIIVFIPLDIYISADPSQEESEQGQKERTYLLDFWLLTYWSSYVLNWLIIPLLQGYVLAGEFHVLKRVQRAIIVNVPYYFLYFFSFVSLLVIIVLIDDKDKEDGEEGYNILSSQGILDVVIALSMCFGFFCLILCLGYALVKIPVRFWVNSSIREKYKRLLFKIAVYEDQIIKQQNEVSKLFNVAHDVRVEDDIAQYKEDMCKDIHEFTLEIQSRYDVNLRTGSFLDQDPKLYDKFLKGNKPLRHRYLVQLNVMIKNATTNLRKLLSFKQEKIKAAIIAQDIIKAQDFNEVGKRNWKSQAEKSMAKIQYVECPYFKQRNPDSCIDKLFLRFQKYWYIYDYRATAYQTASVFFTCLSLLILGIEISYFFQNFQGSWVQQFLIEDQLSRNFLVQNLIFMIPFGYLFYAAFYGLFNFDQIQFLALHWNHNTDPYCLMYSCINTWRLSIPIAYNFLELMAVEKCAFLEVMGNVKKIPIFGKQMDEYVFPISLFVMVLITATDAYNRCLGCFGKYNTYIASNDETRESRITDGQFIIDKFRRERFSSRFSGKKQKAKRWSMKLEESLIEQDSSSEGMTSTNHSDNTQESPNEQSQGQQKQINTALQNMEEIEEISKSAGLKRNSMDGAEEAPGKKKKSKLFK